MTAIATERPYILVTGSSGLIGSAVSSLLAMDYPVAGLDTDKPSKSIGHFTWFEMDLTDDASVNDAVERVRGRFGDHIASVVHLAAYYDFSGEPSPLYEEVTVRGTHRLLGAIKPLRVEQFIFSSTMLVHAPCKPGEQIDENAPLKPSWDYPESKLRTEQLIRRERGDIPAVMLRIAGVYDDDCHCIPLAHQIQRIYEERMTSYVYLGDIIFALAGSTRRWQYRPWLVVLFGIDVIPLGIVSAILVALQGTVVGAWCFLCLMTAAISLILVVLAYDEVWSCVLYLWRIWRKTRSPRVFWNTFWGRPSKVAHEVALSVIQRKDKRKDG